MKIKMMTLAVLSSLLSACGSMSFGEAALDTLSVFGDASEIKRCYESGGGRGECEGRE